MEFVTNINKEEFDEFVQKNKYNHFLQSYDWGEFCKLEKGLTPYYVGIKSNNTLVATALLLEKKLPFNFTYYYSPKGFILDYNDYNLFNYFSKQISIFLKTKNALFLKIDPEYIIKRENCNNEITNFEYNKFFNNLKKIGFKHKGFTKNFDLNQPRYTFMIDFNKSYDEIINNFSKTTKQRINKAKNLDIDIKIGTENDIEKFYNLSKLTENRKDFTTHNISYYKTLYNIFNKDNKCELFLGEINIDKILDKNKIIINQLKEENLRIDKTNNSKSINSKLKENQRRIDKLISDNKKYIDSKNIYGNIINLTGYFIIEFGDKAWVLYAGNHNILTETYANYLAYDKHIKFYYDKGIKTYDQFGTIGDLRESNPLLGLHEFKKKFGGDYVEFIGEFDLVYKPIINTIFNILIPTYRKIKYIINKQKNKH